MQADRELLEKAAKVAGEDLTYDDDDGVATWWTHPTRGTVQWNPLTEDGDALRLAVKLRIHLEFAEFCVIPSTDSAVYASEPYMNVAAAATRRAIVRTAAALCDAKEPRDEQ